MRGARKEHTYCHCGSHNKDVTPHRHIFVRLLFITLYEAVTVLYKQTVMDLVEEVVETSFPPPAPPSPFPFVTPSFRNLAAETDARDVEVNLLSTGVQSHLRSFTVALLPLKSQDKCNDFMELVKNEPYSAALIPKAKPVEYPVRGEIALSSNDLQLVLQVEHNQELLSPDFSETYYTDDGQPVTVTNHNYTDHCFYHGHVRGHPESWVALSTCSGVRGLISLNSSDTYYLEPMSDVDPHHHSLLRAEELPIKGGNCGHGHHTAQSNHISDLLRPFHSRVKRNTWGTTKYMELYIVADNMLFKWQNKDYEKTKARIMEIANYVDKDHSELSIGAAATMAHEIGHNFGMSHDHEGCCVEATAEQGGCVMAAATGHPFPRVFSRCSKRDLDSYFQKGGGMCLFNMPNMKDLVGGKKCGNGFVEDGEECDCGEPDYNCPPTPTPIPPLFSHSHISFDRNHGSEEGAVVKGDVFVYTVRHKRPSEVRGLDVTNLYSGVRVWDL
ncbi:hypothetical protein F2P81_001445 [Scophthalmus maximus]|uniref:Peptidase M12B domain-containing protein n=1 Tax=Scophthalmus maximus TaxID=52904 RepID=A0A6A4TBE3_SCOMX|nr:hypothetical protein F2P81_001445 [Scophthalmus maximus]